MNIQAIQNHWLLDFSLVLKTSHLHPHSPIFIFQSSLAGFCKASVIVRCYYIWMTLSDVRVAQNTKTGKKFFFYHRNVGIYTFGWLSCTQKEQNEFCETDAFNGLKEHLSKCLNVWPWMKAPLCHISFFIFVFFRFHQ